MPVRLKCDDVTFDGMMIDLFLKMDCLEIREYSEAQ